MSKDPPIAALEIRGAVLADASDVAALIGELGCPAGADTIAGRLDELRRAADDVLVAVRDGRVVGLVTTHITPMLYRRTPVGRLTVLVVTAGARGHGIGRALVVAAERALARRGCGHVEVTTNRQRTDAHAFYERLGYEQTSLRFKKALTAG